MFPLEYWSKLHNDYRKFNNGENADELASNRHNEFTRESNVSSIISWSTCCTISQSSPGTCNGFVSATPLVWLTAGLDGYVYGRELNIEINDDKPSMTKRTDKFWRLDLAAHNPMSVTSADISPGGQYLITGSTDQTARVCFFLNYKLLINDLVVCFHKYLYLIMLIFRYGIYSMACLFLTRVNIQCVFEQFVLDLWLPKLNLIWMVSKLLLQEMMAEHCVCGD